MVSRSTKSFARTILLTYMVGVTPGCKSPIGDSQSLASEIDLPSQDTHDEILDLGIAELHKKLIDGDLKVETLTRFYLSRIARFERNQDKSLRALISENEEAINIAKRMDALSPKDKASKDLIWGIPILIKDNIETKDQFATTAGSTALKNYVPKRDAALVKNLREKGAIILGKANLSQWSGVRAQPGWSATGGQTINPHAPNHSPSGSSSGSAVGVAAGLAVAAIGTETLGSIVSPSGANQVIGIRPAQGIVSQEGMIPVVHQLDAAGPIARRVEDAAIVLDAMIKRDKNAPSFRSMVRKDGLKGKTLGFSPSLETPAVQALWEVARNKMELAGARLVPLRVTQVRNLTACDVFGVLTVGLKTDLEDFLRRLPRDLPVHSLKELLAYNKTTKEESVNNTGVDLIDLSMQSSLNSGDMNLVMAPCQKAAHSWLSAMSQQGLDGVLDLVDGDSTLHGSFAGTFYMAVPLGMAEHSSPKGLGIYVDHGREDVMLAIAAGFEAQFKGGLTPWPKGYGPNGRL